MTEERDVCRVIAWYNKTDESRVGEAQLVGFSFRWLHNFFGEPEDDPLMFLCYELTPETFRKIADHHGLDLTPDWQQFDYVLECYDPNNSNQPISAEELDLLETKKRG